MISQSTEPGFYVDGVGDILECRFVKKELLGCWRLEQVNLVGITYRKEFAPGNCFLLGFYDHEVTKLDNISVLLYV